MEDEYLRVAKRINQSFVEEHGATAESVGVDIIEGTVDGEHTGIVSAFSVAVDRVKTLKQREINKAVS